MKTSPKKSEVASGIHHFDTGPFNWYLIEEQGRLTLVDAGFPGHYQIFRAGLESLGYTLKELEAIVLTHAHADHIGFAERVRKETQVPVFIHKADARMAQKPLQLPWVGLLSNAWRRYTATILGIAVWNGVFTLPRLGRVRTMEHGKTLDIPGRPHILHTPGHTQGEVVLYLPERNTLVSGDTLVTQNLLTGKLGQPQLTNPILNHDFAQAQRSLDMLSELGNLTILPGHGQPWQGNMHEAVALARRSHQKLKTA